jgi:MFS family permease
MAFYGVAVLVLATVFGALDRQILILLAEPMRHSLQLSDTQLGLLQGMGFSLFSGLAAVPIGWLADRYGRRVVLAGCVSVWAAATAACGLVHGFPALFAAAAGMGMGEAAIVPIIYGLIPELVTERRRPLANGIYVLAVLLGGGLGIALGGLLLNHLGAISPHVPAALRGLETWRLAFICVAIPGPLIAALILTIGGRSSRQGERAEAVPKPRVTGVDYFRANGQTLVSVFVGIGLAQLGLAAMAIWLPVIAARNYGAAAADIGQAMGTAYMLGTGAGALLGALVMPRLKRRTGLAMTTRVIVAGLSVAAAVIFALLFAYRAAQLYVLFGLQMGAVTAPTLLVPTLLQDITPASLRSRAIAAGSFVMIA